MINRLHDETGKDVNIMAHSFGGLLVRQYLRVYQDDEDGTKVNKVVTIGTPHRGAQIAIAANGLTHAALWGACNLITSSIDCFAAAADVISGLGADQMVPGSTLLQNLALPKNVVDATADRFMTIASTDDGIAPFDSSDGYAQASRATTCNDRSLSFLNSPWGDVGVHMTQMRVKATHRITSDFFYTDTKWVSSNSRRQQAIDDACARGTDPKDEY